MSRKLKLIWEFMGDDAEQTAEHHAIHLHEFVEREKYTLKETGHEKINDKKALAYLVIKEEDMLKFRDALKPHYGEYVEE